MNAEEVPRAWECHGCGKWHADQREAQICCPPQLYLCLWQCQECVKIWFNRGLAEECCQPRP
jgi:hypothetical protein